MYDVNKVVIRGRLGRDPESYEFENGRKAVNFSVATEGRPNKEGEKKTTWHRVSFYVPQDSAMEARYQKGDRVDISAQLSNRVEETPMGEKKYHTDLVGKEIVKII